MDLIVTVCRVLANRHRLRLLRAVYAQPGTTVQPLASATGLVVPEVSKHLKLLGGFHLVQATPQGRYVHYAPARPRNTSHLFLRDMQGLIREFFSPPPFNSTLRKVWNLTAAADDKAEDELLMKLFTTYTHLRRLMILRYLLQHGPASAEQLAGTLKISAPAVHRHLHKLQRREVVSVAADSPFVWCLVRPAGFACRRQLLDIILRTLKAASRCNAKRLNSTLS